MTDTITTAEPEYGTDPQEGPQTPLVRHRRAPGPNSRQLGDNVHEYPNLTRPFLDSIAEHGVLSPITAIGRHDGIVEVRNGPRRMGVERVAGRNSASGRGAGGDHYHRGRRASTGVRTQMAQTPNGLFVKHLRVHDPIREVL